MEGKGWFRAGKGMRYFKNAIPRGSTCYYTFSFAIEFEHDDDTVYLAYCYPYTYTDLQLYVCDAIAPLISQAVRVAADFCASCSSTRSGRDTFAAGSCAARWLATLAMC